VRLSKRSEYGIRALIHLADLESDDYARIHEIADQELIPIKFLEFILLNLKNAGVLVSKPGRGGGYRLRQSAEEINVGTVIRTLDGPIAPIGCVSETSYQACGCPDEATCGLRTLMFDVRESMVGILDHTSLADIARKPLGESP